MLDSAPAISGPAKLSRRAFMAAAAFAPQAFAAQQGIVESQFWNQARMVWLYRPATRESIRTYYWADGQLIESEYRRICWFLRDVRAGKAMFMSPVLLDMLYAQCGWLRYHGIEQPVHTHSGARFRETNAITEGAARDSLHMEGRAHDGSIPGISTETLFKLGAWLGGGGVGYYPNKNFCHMDDGRIRYWRG